MSEATLCAVCVSAAVRGAEGGHAVRIERGDEFPDDATVADRPDDVAEALDRYARSDSYADGSYISAVRIHGYGQPGQGQRLGLVAVTTVHGTAMCAPHAAREYRGEG